MTKFEIGCKILRDGVPMATPCFDGATEVEIKELLALLIYLNRSDDVYDGRTGDAFDASSNCWLHVHA